MPAEIQPARFGLTLSKAERALLAAGRQQALRDTGRVEFGRGILPQLETAFCDAPAIQREDWADTLLTLQEVFYYLKNQAGDLTPDQDVIRLMRRVFDRKGDAAFLAGFSLKELQDLLEEGR